MERVSPVSPEALRPADLQQKAEVDLTSPNVVNALIHLYRAEVGRLTTYRVRLDTTTNWAITTSALVISFTFANPQIPHAGILVLLFLDYFFLQVEARRFRAYEASRYRVHVSSATSSPTCWARRSILAGLATSSTFCTAPG